MAQRKINRDAWDILNKDEQSALSLSLSYGKSTWEAGEILQKAHYKYLEIAARGGKFLRMFTEFFDGYGGLIPLDSTIPASFKEYLSHVILSRNTVKDAVIKMADSAYKVPSFRDRVMDDILTRMRMSKAKSDRDLLDLILEFDRWNNFRVLPRNWQQPSAFKRRNKSKDLKYLKNISNIHPLSLKKIFENYRYDGGKDKLYVPFVAKGFDKGFEVMAIRANNKSIDHMTRMGFPIYTKAIDAEEFAIMVHRYIFKVFIKDNPVTTGLKFWEQYRKYIVLARNYESLEHIIPNRKYMEDARIEEGVAHKRKLRRRVIN